jgi:uncharacterized membrane protein YvbJ
MTFCIGCGQRLAQGTRFCRFCGSHQPDEQVLMLLRNEAQQIQMSSQTVHQQQMNDQTIARMEQMRREAEFAQQQRMQYQQDGQQPRW